MTRVTVQEHSHRTPSANAQHHIDVNYQRSSRIFYIGLRGQGILPYKEIGLFRSVVVVGG